MNLAGSTSKCLEELKTLRIQFLQTQHSHTLVFQTDWRWLERVLIPLERRGRIFWRITLRHSFGNQKRRKIDIDRYRCHIALNSYKRVPNWHILKNRCCSLAYRLVYIQVSDKFAYSDHERYNNNYNNLWSSSKRWASSSILLPLQRGHILVLVCYETMCSFQASDWNKILSDS